MTPQARADTGELWEMSGRFLCLTLFFKKHYKGLPEDNQDCAFHTVCSGALQLEWHSETSLPLYVCIVLFFPVFSP